MLLANTVALAVKFEIKAVRGGLARIMRLNANPAREDKHTAMDLTWCMFGSFVTNTALANFEML